ncbi:MAG: hypothetical protein P1V97_28775 [Planctomycetota bacterium]|nr:hypothetical protein [Planctomycetota bacterium]
MKRRELKAMAKLWSSPGLCRWELSQELKWRPNTLGDVVRSLLQQEILREGKPTLTNGRPKTPLFLNSDSRYVLGLTVTPSRVECARINLLGELAGEKFYKSVESPKRIDVTTRTLFERTLTPDCLGAGVVIASELHDATSVGPLVTELPTRLEHALKQAAPSCAVTVAPPWRALAARALVSNGPNERLLFLYLGKQSIDSLISNEKGVLKSRPLGELLAHSQELGKAQTVNDAWSDFQTHPKSRSTDTKLLTDILDVLCFSLANVFVLFDLRRLVVGASPDVSADFSRALIESWTRRSPRLEKIEAAEFTPSTIDSTNDAGFLALEDLLL